MSGAASAQTTVSIMLAALPLTVGGPVFLPLDVWVKGCMLIGIAILVSAAIVLMKTLRDREGSGKILDKLEDAETEQLLMRLDHGGGRP